MSEQKSLWESVRVEVTVTPMNTPACECGNSTNDNSGSAPELHYESLAPEYAKLVADALHGTMPTPPHLNEIKSDEFKRAMATMAAAGENMAAGGGGVFGTTYNLMFGGEITATTATDATHSHPHVDTEMPGRFDKRYSYRVTFDGKTYVLPSQLAFMEYEDGSTLYVFEYVGNISLYRASITGLLNQSFNVPFLLVADDEDNSGTYIIHLYTDVAGEHTVKIEKVVLDFEKISPALIYGNMYVPFQYTNKSSTYEGFSVGVNKLLTHRFMYALGYGNTVSGEGACAIGIMNNASGLRACAIGTKNESSGEDSMAFGFANKASGNYARAFGRRNTASGNQSFADGQRTIASGTVSHAEGDGCRTAAFCSHVEGGGTYADETQAYTHIGGVNNAISTETGKTVTVTRYNEDGTVANTNTKALGKYAEVIGNGDSDAARSNARALDWDGNEELAGGLTLGKGTENETAITAAQLKALLAML